MESCILNGMCMRKFMTCTTPCFQKVDTNKELRAGRTVIDSIVWAPYGDLVVEDPERQRYLDRTLGIAKIVLPEAIDHFHQDKNGSFPMHLEHVRPCRQARLLTPARESQA